MEAEAFEVKPSQSGGKRYKKRGKPPLAQLGPMQRRAYYDFDLLC